MEMMEPVQPPPADDNECPMEPHSVDQGFTQKKRPEEKSVAELRAAMKAGHSTQTWRQNGSTFTEVKNLGLVQPEPQELTPPIRISGQAYELSIAAHHLIPGKASLPGSGVAKYIWANKGGEIESDIGYDVDGSENGVWMPTHQIVSAALGRTERTIFVHENERDPPATPAFSWRQLSKKAQEASGDERTYAELFLPRYTQQAIHGMRVQFHDSHSDYNSFVTRQLGKIAVMTQTRVGLCPKCPKEKPFAPPYSLVNRLNRLSMMMRNMLTGAPRALWRTLYTSKFSVLAFDQPLTGSKLTGNP